MGLDWQFFRITPAQRHRLLNEPSFELMEAIHEERDREGLGFWYSPDDVGEESPPFDTIYHLSLRTSYDQLEDLMLLEGDAGPVLEWPLGETGATLKIDPHLVSLVAPDEVQTLAPAMLTLLDSYLDQRFERQMDQLAEPEQAELEELYPELKTCFADLTHFVHSAARQGDAIMWYYG